MWPNPNHAARLVFHSPTVQTLSAKRPPGPPEQPPLNDVVPPAATNAAAANAAAADPKAVAWWQALRSDLGTRATNLNTAFKNMRTNVATSAKTWKPPEMKGLGMRVDVDVLKPAVATVKEAWANTPEPVREVAPFFATGVATTLVVSVIYRLRLNHERQRYDSLREDFKFAHDRQKELEAEIQSMKANAPQQLLSAEINMSDSISRAAAAAAAAATAAGNAAEAASRVAMYHAQTFGEQPAELQPQQLLKQQQQQQQQQRRRRSPMHFRMGSDRRNQVLAKPLEG